MIVDCLIKCFNSIVVLTLLSPMDIFPRVTAPLAPLIYARECQELVLLMSSFLIVHLDLFHLWDTLAMLRELLQNFTFLYFVFSIVAI